MQLWLTMAHNSLRVPAAYFKNRFNTPSLGFVFLSLECLSFQWEFLYENFLVVLPMRTKFLPGQYQRFCSPEGFLLGSWKSFFLGEIPGFLLRCRILGGILVGSWRDHSTYLTRVGMETVSWKHSGFGKVRRCQPPSASFAHLIQFTLQGAATKLFGTSHRIG